jgi:hypothetical protein
MFDGRFIACIASILARGWTGGAKPDAFRAMQSAIPEAR